MTADYANPLSTSNRDLTASTTTGRIEMKSRCPYFRVAVYTMSFLERLCIEPNAPVVAFELPAPNKPQKLAALAAYCLPYAPLIISVKDSFTVASTSIARFFGY